MKNIYKLEIVAPFFPGFYNTIFEMEDQRVEDDIDSEVVPKFTKAGLMEEGGVFTLQTLCNDYFGSDAYRDANKSYMQEVGQETATFLQDLLQKETGLEESVVEFKNIWSPREYNFRNDSVNIDVAIDTTRMIEILEGPAYAIFKALIEAEYTSVSGFSSFYDNDIATWVKDWEATLDDSTMAGTCFEAMCAYLLSTEEDLSERSLESILLEGQEDLYEYVISNTGPYFNMDDFMLEVLLDNVENIMLSNPEEMVSNLVQYPSEERVGAVLNPMLEKCGSSAGFLHTAKGSLTNSAKDGLKKLCE